MTAARTFIPFNVWNDLKSESLSEHPLHRLNYFPYTVSN